MDISGIYKITNIKNGRIYIGSSCNIRKRWHGHAASLRCGKHYNQFLQHDYNKCGADAFVYELLESTEHLDQNARLALEEEYIMKYYDHGKNCYNLCAWAVEGPGKYKDPVSTKAKISAKSQANWDNPEWRENQIKLIQEAARRPETIARRLISCKKSWQDNEARSQNHSKKMKEFHANNEEVSAKVTKALAENQPKGRVTFREKMKTDPEFRAIYVKTGLEKTARNNKRYAEDPEYKAMMDAKSRENFQRYNEQKIAAMPFKPPIVAPDGTVYSEVKSVSQFAKEHDLDASSLYKLFNNKINTYRGWAMLAELKPTTHERSDAASFESVD
jgi:group I intron endonuclease